MKEVSEQFSSLMSIKLVCYITLELFVHLLCSSHGSKAGQTPDCLFSWKWNDFTPLCSPPSTEEVKMKKKIMTFHLFFSLFTR